MILRMFQQFEIWTNHLSKDVNSASRILSRCFEFSDLKYGEEDMLLCCVFALRAKTTQQQVPSSYREADSYFELLNLDDS